MSRSILFLLFHCAASMASAQYRNMFFNSSANIARLDFSVMPAVVKYTGISNGFEGIAHAEDSLGNILFFVNNNGVYRGDGSLMAGSSGIFVDPSTTEIAVTPVPNQSGKYYLIYNNELCSPLFYSVVDMNLDGGQGNIADLNHSISDSAFAEGLEIVQKPCSNECYLLAYECGKSLKRFTVTDTGFADPTDLVSIPTPPPVSSGTSIYEGRGEIEYQNGKVGIAFTFTRCAWVADFDPVTGTVSNDTLLQFSPSGNSGIYGLEFSHDARMVYVSHWYQLNADNLFRYDFLTQTTAAYHLASDALDQFHPATGPGQIELGPDGNLYVSMDGGDEIIRIAQSDQQTPVFSKLSVNSTLGMGISDLGQMVFLSKDTFDLIACLDTSVGLFAPAIPGSTYSWSNGSTDDHIYVSNPGTYTVEVSGICPATKVYNVYSPLAGFPQELTICPGDSTQIGHWVPGGSYSWNTGDTVPFITPPADGVYILDVSTPQCATVSDTVLVKVKSAPKPLQLPNVFTPNLDAINDFFEPTAVSQDSFRVCIYDRWGRKVGEFTDSSLQGWDGRSEEGQPLPAGVYFWTSEMNSECSDGQLTDHGFVHLFSDL